MRDDFDRWLEDNLKRRLDAQSGLHSRPGQARYALLERRRGLAGFAPLAGGAAAAKIRAGAAVALAAAGAATTGAVTHSSNPTVWGRQVSAAVTSCRNALSTGQHGLGDCVSAFAQSHVAPSPSETARGNATTPPSPRTEGRSDSKAQGQGGEGNSDQTHGAPASPGSEAGGVPERGESPEATSSPEANESDNSGDHRPSPGTSPGGQSGGHRPSPTPNASPDD
jgi:hypothetical protein